MCTTCICACVCVCVWGGGGGAFSLNVCTHLNMYIYVHRCDRWREGQARPARARRRGSWIFESLFLPPLPPLTSLCVTVAFCTFPPMYVPGATNSPTPLRPAFPSATHRHNPCLNFLRQQRPYSYFFFFFFIVADALSREFFTTKTESWISTKKMYFLNLTNHQVGSSNKV